MKPYYIEIYDSYNDVNEVYYFSTQVEAIFECGYMLGSDPSRYKRATLCNKYGRIIKTFVA